MKEKNINNITEFVNYIETECKVATEKNWFRGLSNSKYQLIPSLYRHPEKKTHNEFSILEASLLDKFKERSLMFSDNKLEGNWDYEFYMQHHGVPTRLLDWTENPFIALFFAVSDQTFDKSNVAESDSIIFLLNPEKWNKIAFAHMSFPGGILSCTHDYMKAYEPNSSNLPANPVAIYGIHNSRRIIAQRGVFTIFGSDVKPLEELYSTINPSEDILKKLIIPKDKVFQIREELFNIGYTDSVIYPDLFGLSKELRREFKYE